MLLLTDDKAPWLIAPSPDAGFAGYKLWTLKKGEPIEVMRFGGSLEGKGEFYKFDSWNKNAMCEVLDWLEKVFFKMELRQPPDMSTCGDVRKENRKKFQLAVRGMDEIDCEVWYRKENTEIKDASMENLKYANLVSPDNVVTVAAKLAFQHEITAALRPGVINRLKRLGFKIRFDDPVSGNLGGGRRVVPYFGEPGDNDTDSDASRASSDDDDTQPFARLHPAA